LPSGKIRPPKICPEDVAPGIIKPSFVENVELEFGFYKKAR
jgi:hypothetical protein